MSAAVAEGMLAIVKAATEPLIAEIKSLRAEVAALKAAPPVQGTTGQPGRDGSDGKDGKDGRDGADAPPVSAEQVIAAVESMPHVLELVVAKHFEAHPVRHGVDGKDGAAGRDGQDGASGRDGQDAPAPTVEQVKAALADMSDELSLVVAKHFEAHPVRDGADGRDGKDGTDGRDGVGMAGAVIDREGALVVTFTDGSTKPLGIVVGAKGEPGRDGDHGLGFGDLQVEHDGERTFTLKAVKGEQVLELGSFTVPSTIYRGVYEAGRAYVKGDAVTYAGDFWIAKEDTRATPIVDKGKGWQQAVKRGKPGEPGKPGAPGPQGLKGDKGDRVAERW
jgi:hypothetical protein